MSASEFVVRNSLHENPLFLALLERVERLESFVWNLQEGSRINSRYIPPETAYSNIPIPQVKPLTYG